MHPITIYHKLSLTQHRILQWMGILVVLLGGGWYYYQTQVQGAATLGSMVVGFVKHELIETEMES